MYCAVCVFAGVVLYALLHIVDSHTINIHHSGIVVQLCNPYPRAVSEPAVYEDANVVTTGLTDEEVEQLKEKLEPKSSSAAPKKRLSSNPTPALSDGSGSPAVGGGAGGGAGGRASASSSVSSASGCQHQPYLSVSITTAVKFVLVCIYCLCIIKLHKYNINV